MRIYRRTLIIAVGVLFLGVTSGAAALYGAAHLWMLDEEVDLRLAITDPAAGGRATIDLARPRVDFVLQVCCDHSTVIDDFVGRPARLFRIRPTDPLIKGNFRAELRIRPSRHRRETWYQGEIHVPADWRPSDLSVIAMQWHGTRDLLLMETGRTAPLSLSITGDRWQITKSWDRRIRSATADDRDLAVHGRAVIGETTLVPGRWVQWTFQVRWSAGEDGMIRVWQDGEPVVDDFGPNTYNDLIGPYFKAGVYVPDWFNLGPEPGISERLLRFAALRVAGGKNPFGIGEVLPDELRSPPDPNGEAERPVSQGSAAPRFGDG